MNATEAEKNEIRNQTESRIEYGTTFNLAPLATALIEVDGRFAIDWLEQNYLARHEREEEAITEILNALSVHGANEELRSRIAESYATALETHPNAAARAAFDLTIWRDRRFTHVAREVLSMDRDFDPAVAYAVENYAAMQND